MIGHQDKVKFEEKKNVDTNFISYSEWIQGQTND